MLLGSSVLEIAIGLALIYMLFAVICSALNEWLAGILKLRARTLREGIQKLLSDPNGEHLAKQFFEHPLFRGLTPGNNQAFPSYIPARTFARILIDIVSPAQGARQDLTELYKRIRDVVANLSSSDNDLGRPVLIVTEEWGPTPAKIAKPPRPLKNLENPRRDLLDYVSSSGNEIAQIEFAATTLEKLGDLETTLKRTQDEATAALYQAQANVEEYFTQTMERLSGWYKRRVQVFIILFALALSLLLNIDSLEIANRLANDPALRQTLVVVAEQTTTLPQSGDEPLARANQVLDQIEQLGIPIGWQRAPASTTDWIAKILGLLISTAAIAQGAPFWFDLLGKLINVRMTGKKPATPGEKTNEP
ncbi:MAG TPA: hypothetical protein PKE45_02060 [Caldilineaceae bacterium]|nr:hypothetical protein [Caldilineaceae bacterium]